MKLVIEINEKSYIESYLSILSIGILECLENNILNYDDAMNILYFPGMIEKLEKEIPKVGEAIHLGTELEDVAELVPSSLEKAINQIKELNKNSINFDNNGQQNVFYKLTI